MAPTLLVPFDGRPAAQAALRAACSIARLDGSAVVTLYVVRIPRQLPLSARLPWMAQEVREIQERAEHLGQEQGVAVWSEWVYARDVARAVTDVAEELAVDQIVLGIARSQRLPIWLWPWSTTAQILNRSARPVLLRTLPATFIAPRGAASRAPV